MPTPVGGNMVGATTGSMSGRQSFAQPMPNNPPTYNPYGQQDRNFQREMFQVLSTSARAQYVMKLCIGKNESVQDTVLRVMEALITDKEKADARYEAMLMYGMPYPDSSRPSDMSLNIPPAPKPQRIERLTIDGKQIDPKLLGSMTLTMDVPKGIMGSFKAAFGKAPS